MKRHAPILILAVCVGVFVLGVVQLFRMRLEQGDVYPPYSSLRADPLGTMALYESLQRMPGLEVRRDFSARNQLPESRDTTYLHLAGDPGDWRWMPESLVVEIEGFLARGGRLVVTCEPETTATGSPDRAPTAARGTNAPAARPKRGENVIPVEEPAKPRQPGEGPEDDEDPLSELTQLNERWGFAIGYERLPRGVEDDAGAVTVTNRSALPLPATLTWRSSTLFNSLSTNWQVIYARGTNAVVMERRFGRGTLVFAGDSYFVSNEALLAERHADLLAWLVGPNRLVYFDEAHLGVVETPGVATLMRRYRLHGVMAGLALLMGLFVWKNSFSLVPPPPSAQAQDFVAGRDTSAGFVNLLRRSIAPGDLLMVCFGQWEKSAAGRHDLAPSRVELAKQTVAAELARTGRDRNPVAVYQQVSTLLKPGGARAPANSSTPKTTA